MPYSRPIRIEPVAILSLLFILSKSPFSFLAWCLLPPCLRGKPPCLELLPECDVDDPLEPYPMRTTPLLLGVFLATSSAYGQATVIFGNRIPGLVDARIFAVNQGSVTPADSRFLAQLYASAPGSPLRPVGDPVRFRDQPGAARGYFPSVMRTIPNVPEGAPVHVQVRAWYGMLGETYEEALNWNLGAFGVSAIVQIPATGGGLMPPVHLVGLTGFTITESFAYIPPRGPVIPAGQPRAPRILGAGSSEEPIPQRPADLAVAGSTLFVAASYTGLSIVDGSATYAPSLSQYAGPVGRAATGVAADTSHTFLISGPKEPGGVGGLLSIYAFNPSLDLVQLGSLELPQEMRSPVRWQDSLFLASANANVAIVDIHDPAHPVLRSEIPDTSGAFQMAPHDHWLFLTTDRSLKVIDLAGSPGPKVVAKVPTPAAATFLSVQGNLAGVVSLERTLLVFDITVPENPRLLSTFVLPRTGQLGPVSLSGNFAFVTQQSAGVGNTRVPPLLSVVDLSDPTHPEIVGQTTLGADAIRIASQGDLLWVADVIGISSFSIGPELTLHSPSQLALHGHTGGRYRLEAAAAVGPNAAWTPVAEVPEVTLSGASLEISVPTQPSLPTRFFRVRSL